MAWIGAIFYKVNYDLFVIPGYFREKRKKDFLNYMVTRFKNRNLFSLLQGYDLKGEMK